MKTHPKISAKVASKYPQQPIQTTLERSSIRRSYEEKSGIKTENKVPTSVGINDENSLSHNLGKINIFRSQHNNSKVNK